MMEQQRILYNIPHEFLPFFFFFSPHHDIMTVPTSNGAPSSPPPSLAELSRRATVDKTDMSKYSIKSWIATVAKLYEQVNPSIKCQAKWKYTDRGLQGDFEYRKNCLDNAYVYYMKGCRWVKSVMCVIWDTS